MRATQESMELIERLLTLLQQDQDDIRACLRGDVLTEYLKATNKAKDVIEDVKKQLSYLQSEQTLGM